MLLTSCRMSTGTGESQHASDAAIRIGQNDLGGVVTAPRTGPRPKVMTFQVRPHPLRPPIARAARSVPRLHIAITSRVAPSKDARNPHQSRTKTV
jgi:hypothetical protein